MKQLGIIYIGIWMFHNDREEHGMSKDNIILGIIIIIFLWSLIEQKLLVTSKYTIKTRKLPIHLNNTRFVLLADLHNRTFGKMNERLIKQIEALTPEFIIVAGDMINKKEACYPSHAFTLLEQLSKKYKIYYAYGNHEQRLELMQEQLQTKHTPNTGTQNTKNNDFLYSTWIEYKSRLINSGVIFLDNDNIQFTKKGCTLSISGVSIERKFFERNQHHDMEDEYLLEILGKSDVQNYQLLIAHNPVYFKEYAKWGADLTLSGHLHGGMVRLPGIGGLISPQAKFFPKYQKGTFEENDQYMVVSRGLGSHSVMPRLFNIPELISVELKNK